MALRGSDQPAAATRRTPGNLPLELTSFVGRRTELTGIGGVGKTRLALHAATEAAREFTDGAWLVELDEVRDGSLVVDVVSAALGIGGEAVLRLSPLDRAEQLLTGALQVTLRVKDPRQGSSNLEVLAWIAGDKWRCRRAAVLMAAAEALARTRGAPTVVLPHPRGFHDRCDRQTRDSLGGKESRRLPTGRRAQFRRGGGLRFGDGG